MVNWQRLLLSLCLLALAACQQTAPIVVVPPPTAAPTAPPTLALVRVYVSGAVKTPGVYTLAPLSLVDDAVKAAGGAIAEADLDRINLALEVRDQQQIHVPRKGESAQSTTTNVAPASSATRVNINTATLADLDKLPKIGPATAQRIIDYRTQNGPFKKIEDLKCERHRRCDVRGAERFGHGRAMILSVLRVPCAACVSGTRITQHAPRIRE